MQLHCGASKGGVWHAASLAHPRALQRLRGCHALLLVPHQQALHTHFT